MNNLTNSVSSVSQKDREIANGHKAAVFWLTGLSGSGKSTIAFEVEKILHFQAKKIVVLDGDKLRSGINADLDFTNLGRTENIRRVAEIAELFKEAGMIVITAFISPFKTDRERAKSICNGADFYEIFVNCPIEICEQRDVKGLYKRARKGEIKNFTGISSIYEMPESPDLIVDTSADSKNLSIQKLVNFIIDKTNLPYE